MKKSILTLITVLLAGFSTAWGQEAKAQVGSTIYSTFDDALVAANSTSESTLTLLADVSVDAQLVVTGTFTLDLNGKTISYVGNSYLTTGIIGVKRGATLTVMDSGTNGTILGGTNAYAAIAVTIPAEAGPANTPAANLIVESGTLQGNEAGITGNGLRHNTNITINGGTITGTSTAGSGSQGIYHPQEGTLTINGGTIQGYSSAVEMRAGTLNITDGNFTAICTTYATAPNANGSTAQGTAIAIAQHTTMKDIDVNISGGTFNGTKAFSVTNPQNNTTGTIDIDITGGTFQGGIDNTDTRVDGFISGGTYDAAVPQEYCAETYTSIGSGPYTVDGPFQAKYVDTGYATFAAAVDVAGEETVELLTNITTPYTMAANQTLKVKKNGYTVTINPPAGYEVKEETDADGVTTYTLGKSIGQQNITIDPATYKGAEFTLDQIKALITVKDGTTTLEEGDTKDYIVTLSGGTLQDAKTYVGAIIISGVGNYAGSISKDFIIEPRNINDVTVTGNSFPYTGSAIEATTISGAITLTYGGATLSKATDGDYTVTVASGTYKDPGTYPGVITLTAVEGAGKNFVGSRTIDLIIQEAINIADCDIVATTVYNGTEQTPAATVVVKRGSTTLVADTDYEITYAGTPNFINAGTTEITITGKAPSCYGSTTVNYVISPKNIADCAITTSTPYTGETITPADKITVKDGETNLAKETDYNLTVSAGTYKDVGVYPAVVTITGIGNYTGEVTRDFSITSENATDISTALVTSTAVYNGANQAPSASTVIVKIGSNTINPENYDVTFTGEASDYKDAKTYANAVIITPKSGNTSYYGSLTADYVIEPYNIAGDNVTVTADDMTWTGGVLTKNQSTIAYAYIVQDGYTITFNNGTSYVDLVKTTDYNITSVPEVIKDEGEYSLVFEGVGNFTGTKSTKFDVKKDISQEETTTGIHFDIPTQIMTGDVFTFANDFSMVATDTKSHTTLNKGEDFTLAFSPESTSEEGQFTVTVTGNSTKYTGSRALEFYVVKDYQTVSTVNGDISLHITSPGYPVAATSPSGAVEAGTTSVGAKTGAAIGALNTRVTIPESKTVTINNTNIQFNITAIEPNAFSDCNQLQWIDATALPTTFTPNSLDRTVSGTTFYGVPKQSLVFLNGNTITGENYIYKKNGSEYICDVFKIYDDVNGNQQGFSNGDEHWFYHNPIAFTANTIENTRQMKAGQHYTICLPYALPLPSTLKAYTLDAASDKILGFKEVTYNPLGAFTPYVVIASGTGNLLSVSTGGYVPATDYSQPTGVSRQQGAKQAGNLIFAGTMAYMGDNYAQGKYIMQGDKTWKKIDASNGYPSACILPMRAYIFNPSNSTSPLLGSRLTATFTNADGSTTAIRDLQLDNDGDDTFDLQGRKVNGQSAAKGVYIKNGKKLYK